MGSIASKKNERFQINYFLFENYKKHIKFDTNFLEAELLPSQLESISYEETPSCFCYNVCVESISWKEYFLERCQKYKEASWFNFITSSTRKKSTKDEVFLSKFSWKIFLTLNHPGSIDLFNTTSCENSSLSYKPNCFLTEAQNRRKSLSSGKRSNNSSNKQIIANSFLSTKVDIICIDKEEQTKNNNLNRNLYKIMSEELENQLNDINNGLACLKFEFISFFLKNLSEKKEKLTKKEAQALITDLKIFIKIFTESLIVCYKLDELSEYIRKSYKSDTNCFNFDNYLMFITNLIFTDKIFDSIFYLQQDLIDYEEQDIFEKKLEEISEKEIEDFEISNEFTLNEKTAQNLKRSFRTISATPYENLIVSLKTITSLKTPFFQLKLLHRISDSIEKEIQQFYDRFDKSFDDFIDTDTFLALHIYIIAKSKLKSLISVLNLIEFFSSEKQRLELSGYYLTIYKASVEYILGI